MHLRALEVNSGQIPVGQIDSTEVAANAFLAGGIEPQAMLIEDFRKFEQVGGPTFVRSFDG